MVTYSLMLLYIARSRKSQSNLVHSSNGLLYRLYYTASIISNRFDINSRNIRLSLIRSVDSQTISRNSWPVENMKVHKRFHRICHVWVRWFFVFGGHDLFREGGFRPTLYTKALYGILLLLLVSLIYVYIPRV